MSKDGDGADAQRRAEVRANNQSTAICRNPVAALAETFGPQLVCLRMVEVFG